MPCTITANVKTYIDWTAANAKIYITANATGALYTISTAFANVMAGLEKRNNAYSFDYTTDASGVPTLASTIVYVQSQRDFTIPLNVLNLIFDHEHLEYFNAID